MPLSSGDKLGPYEITAPLGAGGMGEVYKARDTRLDRTVAVKVLPEEIAKREDLLARFEREARAVASLNHPNICSLFDIGPGYMVMELVDGETLADRIGTGALPLELALKYAVQIADALDRAHRAGVTHRDVKPQNIMVTRDGVKILDFGLAKSTAAGPGPTEETLTRVLTAEGTVLGTPQYMAPELFEGREADARADIWAFGAVLYEMVTGRKAFEGKSYSSLVGAILATDPAPMAIAPFAPSWLERLVRRCLAKDPDDRYQAMRDVVLDLRAPPPEAAAPAPPKASRWSWIAAGALALAFLVAGFGWYSATRPAPLKPLFRLDVDLGADVSLPRTGGVALSPDGTRLVYKSGTPAKLFIRRLDQAKAIELHGTEGATSMFFSPDSRWLGFVAGATLSKISLDGGVSVPLLNMPKVVDGSWGEDGSMLFGGAINGGVMRIPAGGGPPETLAKLAEGDFAFFAPQLLPGGKAVLFSVRHTVEREATIEVLTLADRRRKVVLRGGTNPQYLVDHQTGGHLLYLNQSTLFAIPFDLDTLETHGTAVPVLDDVANGRFSLSPSGSLAYRKAIGGTSTLQTLQWADATGKREPLLAKPGSYANPALSPDGKRVALSVAEGGTEDIWVYDPQRDAMTRLTFGGGRHKFPVWSPDGQYVVFQALGDGIFHARADGAGQPQALTQSKRSQIPRSFTPDGKHLAYFETAGSMQVWTVPLEEHGGRLKAGKPEQFLRTSYSDAMPVFSPDGRWLAHWSNESGKSAVYVRAFPTPSSGQGGKWQISDSGGSYPRWSRNGQELMYESGDQIMSVRYTVKGDVFVAERPRVWIAKRGGREWDLSPDGKRVVVVTPEEMAEAPGPDHQVVLLLNFADELQRKVLVRH